MKGRTKKLIQTYLVLLLLVFTWFGGAFKVIAKSPQRVIVIRFPNREKLEACFGSEQYKAIVFERAESVDARAIIVEE